MVPVAPGSSTQLETTIYKPDGDGPFPLVVINHAREVEPSQQGRYRPDTVARYFLQRGYAVAAPMRRGFSKSGGWYVGASCDVEQNARSQADDVAASLNYLAALPWVDKDRILVAGWSHGGLTALAFGTRNFPGVKGLINFAGGSRNTSCTSPSWQHSLAVAAGAFGKESKVPSLWFYGDNDSFFGQVYRPMHERYTAEGGKAQLVAFGVLGTDAHYVLAPSAASVWQPEVSKFLERLDLPNQPVERFAKFGVLLDEPAPQPTNFAPVGDASKVPNLRFFGRRGYQAFLEAKSPRAFAISDAGEWGWAWGERAQKRALDFCRENSKGKDCKLYAVDEAVVWPGSAALPPAARP